MTTSRKHANHHRIQKKKPKAKPTNTATPNFHYKISYPVQMYLTPKAKTKRKSLPATMNAIQHRKRQLHLILKYWQSLKLIGKSTVDLQLLKKERGKKERIHNNRNHEQTKKTNIQTQEHRTTLFEYQWKDEGPNGILQQLRTQLPSLNTSERRNGPTWILQHLRTPLPS